VLVKTLILETSESRLPNWIIAKSRFFVPGKNGSKNWIIAKSRFFVPGKNGS